MKAGKSDYYKGRTRYWSNLLISIVVVLGIFVFLEILSSNHAIKFDFTPGKIHTLSEQSMKILKSLDSEIKFTTFYRMGEREGLDEFYQRLCANTSKITYKLIDLDRNPGKAKMHGVSGAKTIVECNGKRKDISFPTEERAINVILQLTQGKEKVIFFSRGHGESEEYGEFEKYLLSENWKIEKIYLSKQEDVPRTEGTVLFLGGPEKDFLEHETDILGRYLEGGGKIVALIEPFVSLPSLEDFLKKYKIILANDIIVDKENMLFGGDYLAPLVPYYARCPVTQGMRSSTIFPSARSINIMEEEKDDKISILPIARSAEHSWTKSDIDALKKGKINFKEGVDARGPINVGVWVKIADKHTADEDAKGELILFGDSDFAKDSYLKVLGNKDLLLNAVAWLGRDKDLISIRTNKFEYPYHYMEASHGRFIFWACIVVLPAIFLIIGIATLMVRKLRG